MVYLSTTDPGAWVAIQFISMNGFLLFCKLTSAIIYLEASDLNCLFFCNKKENRSYIIELIMFPAVLCTTLLRI